MAKQFLDPSKFIRIKKFEEDNKRRYCEIVFFDKELFGYAIEFYNQYFGYIQHPINEEEALKYAELGVRINADLWKAMMPMSEDKMNYFYAMTPLYFFHNILRMMDGIHTELMHDFLDNYNDPILDFAGGSGGISLFLAKHGKKVTFYDGNVIQSAWMHWINKKLNLGINVINNPKEITGKFNFIIAKDIAEHVMNPQGLLEYLLSFLESNSAILFTETDIQGPDEFAPMHFKISKDNNKLLFDLDYNNKCLSRTLSEFISSYTSKG